MNTDNVIKLDKVDLCNRFYCCEDSSTGLRFNKDIVRGSGKGYVYKSKGDEAGHKSYSRDGVKHMMRVQLNSTRHAAVHRIIWTMLVGDIADGHVIDHIDGDPFNNKISNLRSIPSGENARNAKKRKDNKTGVTGVTYCEGHPPKSYPYFSAVWKENGKHKTRSFSTRRYGFEEAFKLACSKREEMIQMLNNNEHGYTERHGT